MGAGGRFCIGSGPQRFPYALGNSSISFGGSVSAKYFRRCLFQKVFCSATFAFWSVFPTSGLGPLIEPMDLDGNIWPGKLGGSGTAEIIVDGEERLEVKVGQLT